MAPGMRRATYSMSPNGPSVGAQVAQRRPGDQRKTLFRRIEHGKTIGDVRPRDALEDFEGVFVQFPWIGKPHATKMRGVAPVRWEEEERIAKLLQAL